MPLDPQRVRFKGKVISAAREFGGSVEDTDAAQFVEVLFSEWSSTGQSLESAESWLSSRLAAAFTSVAGPPDWVEAEPAWPFFNGEPMVFISQARVVELSPGEVAYLFGARRTIGSGFKMVYRVVSQFEEGR